MHKSLRCTCSQNPPLLSSSFLISFDITQSLLLDLCLCNPLSLLLIGVECNSFVPQFTYSPALRHKSYLSLFLLVVHHSWLLLFGWCICGSWICCCLILPISLALVPSSFLPLLSFSRLLFVADCHVNFTPFLLHSHFVDWCVTFFSRISWTNSLFPFSSAL